MCCKKTPNENTSDTIQSLMIRCRDSNDNTEFYANNLKFLWEQYIKFINFGIIAAGTTLGFIVQSFLLNEKIREINANHNNAQHIFLNVTLLKTAILSTSISAVCFIISRWCSQILMERQVYGEIDKAIFYFKETLNDETILPTAVQPKSYMCGLKRKHLLWLIGHSNEIAKWSGVIALAFGWYSLICYALPLVTPQ